MLLIDICRVPSGKVYWGAVLSALVSLGSLTSPHSTHAAKPQSPDQPPGCRSQVSNKDAEPSKPRAAEPSPRCGCRVPLHQDRTVPLLAYPSQVQSFGPESPGAACRGQTRKKLTEGREGGGGNRVQQTETCDSVRRGCLGTS
jgi:hypothetical protein